MLLEKPQSKVVERVLTDVYDAGRDAVLRAYTDWELTDRKTDFMVWYQKYRHEYSMKFKVAEQ